MWFKKALTMEWVKITYGWIMNNGKKLLAEIHKPKDVVLIIYCDPRTQKPWRSMKQAKEWLDEAISNL